MLYKLRYLNLIIVFAVTVLLGFMAPKALATCSNPATTQEQIQCGACNASGITEANCPSEAAKAPTSLSNTVAKIINIASIIAGAIAVVMLIIGGVRYITSSGNEQAVAGAKRTIIYALVGLVIVGVAQVVVHYVLNNVNQSIDCTPSKTQKC